MITDPADTPFRSREQAEHAFAGFRQAAERGGGQHLAEALTDTIETLIAPAEPLGEPLGEYDRAVIGKVAAALDPVDVEVLCSMIRRAAHDQPRP